MAIQLCRGFRDEYLLSFDKISKGYPIGINGTYASGDTILIIDNGSYSLFTPAIPPYTCQESGTLIENGDGTITITPLKIIGCGSGVSGYADLLSDLPTADSTQDSLIYQVGLYPNCEWYQCICIGGSCSWVLISNPVCEEIDSLLDLPDEPCSGNKIYYGDFGSNGEIIYYGCVLNNWRDVVNPNDALSFEGVACVGLPMTIPFALSEGYSTPKNAITAFDFKVVDNSILTANAIGIIDEATRTITVEIPYGIDMTSLVPSITILGARIEPSSSVANDFTNETEYRCYSSSGTVKVYSVTVSYSSNAVLTEFWFDKDLNSSVLSSDFYGVITGTDIVVDLPYGVVITSLIPSFVTNAVDVKVGTTIQVSDVTSNNYTTTVNYLCYDYNDTAMAYSVNVYTSDTPTNKAITQFILRSKDNSIFSTDYSGVIIESSHMITVTVPNRVNFSEIYPTIYITGISVVTNSRDKADFSADDVATFTVTDALGGTQAYTVTIVATDDPSQKIDLKYNAETSDEDALAASGWVESVNFGVGLPDEIKEMLTSISSHMETIKSLLNVGKGALNIAKVLLAGVGNPVLAAFEFFLNELITFIGNLKNSGFFYAQITPDAKLFIELFVDQTILNPHYRDGRLEKLLSDMTSEERSAYDKLVLSTRDIHFFNFKKPVEFALDASNAINELDPTIDIFDPDTLKQLVTENDVLQTLKTDESISKVVKAKYWDNQQKSGFWLLPGASSLKILAESFDNIHDVDQPLYNPPIPIKNYSYYTGGVIDYKTSPTLLSKDEVLAGGLILWIGFGGGSDLIKAIKTFVQIIRELSYFFGDSKLKTLLSDLQEVQNKFWGVWKPNTKYYIGDIVTAVEAESAAGIVAAGDRKTLDKYKYVCTKVSSDGYGTSGGSEPSWPETFKESVTDNDITWTESSITSFPVRTEYPKIWQKKKIFRDWFKSGGDVLDELEALLVGFRDKIPSGYESIDNVIAYLESRIAEIETLINLIQSFIELVDTFGNMTAFDMHGYMVPVQNGGISRLIEGALDESDPKKPTDSDYTLSLFAFIGTGASIPGYLLLSSLLFSTGGPSEFSNSMDQAAFPWGLDTLTESPFPDEDTLKKKFFDGDKVQSDIEVEMDDINTNNPF